MADHGLVEALEPFSVVLEDGTPFAVSRGDRFHADDPITKGRDRLFGPLSVRSSRPARPTPAAAVETASAAPGSRRQRTTPTGKDSAKDDAKGGDSDA